jgi:carbon-monoxide dehydrogenase medium subunit
MYEFNYQRASSVADAAKKLATGEDARLLAGGQTLIAAMKLRLANPTDLVDLGGIAGLRGIKADGSGIIIGAMTTHAEVASSKDVRKQILALAELAESIGDPMVRNMGTIGGSVANNDPAADYPAGLVGLGATVKTNQREIDADDFFTGMFMTALEPGEIIESIRFPKPARAAYMKFANPASRYAIVGVFVAQTGNTVRVAVTGAGASVFRVPEMEKALTENFAPDAIAGISVASDELNADMHASAGYRAHLVTVMAKRAVERAVAG